MTENILMCPTCQRAFDTTEREQDMPQSHLTQVCPSCDTEITVGLVYYPDNSYVAIGPALDTDSCDNAPRHTACDADAHYRLQRVGYPLHTRCETHTPQYLSEMIDV